MLRILDMVTQEITNLNQSILEQNFCDICNHNLNDYFGIYCSDVNIKEKKTNRVTNRCSLL